MSTTPDTEKDQLKDPVCNMTVAGDSAYHYHYSGNDYYFCSERCLNQFKEHPEQYLDKKTTPSSEKHVVSMIYTCPMHPEIQRQGPGHCPKCGMALESMGVPATAMKTEYTCPMHPEVVQDHPGNCPKCGMALEPVTVGIEGENEELLDMSRRFWVCTVLALPVFFLAMIADMMPSLLPDWLSMQTVQWVQFTLATPVVLWGGWPFFVRGWQSVRTWNLNMFTLIALCVSVAWVYSVVALLFPRIFPP
ncbi:MAG: heavy metal-binding domain-containing protein, partial [Syntrophales bacterium]|nr:heavy metal-binding domain-containing protein [Syntrophales bacterium]